MMQRLIDANHFLEVALPHCIRPGSLRDMVDDEPTVDAVPVVRCKDCKYAHMTTRGEVKYCDVWFPEDAEYADGDYYCANGERKDGEQNR